MVRLFSLLALLGIAPFASAQRPVAPIDVRAQWTPTYFRSQAHTVVAYELRVTNVSTREITLKQLDVFGDALTGRHLIQLQADSLRDAIATVGVRDTTIPPTQIRSGRQVIVFVWLDLGSGVKAPATLVHRFLLGRPDSAAKPPDTVGPVRIAVSSAPPIVLSTPLDHGLWLARHGPSNIADHRRTVISVNGVSTIAQRFATDWIMLGPDHRMWHGDSTVNRNWYGYGTTIHAAANGVVVAERDGIPENAPLSPTRAVPITRDGRWKLRDRAPGRRLDGALRSHATGITKGEHGAAIAARPDDRTFGEFGKLRRSASPLSPYGGRRLPTRRRGNSLRLSAVRGRGNRP